MTDVSTATSHWLLAKCGAADFDVRWYNDRGAGPRRLCRLIPVRGVSLVRLASFLAAVFPHWAGLQLDSVCLDELQLIVDLPSTRRSARCPDCQRRSRRAHSWFAWFARVVADVTLGVVPVSLHLHARRYRCLNAACPRQTFRERLPEVAPPYQRRTPILRQRLEAVSFALAGQAGQRLARHLHLGEVGTSRNSLLRLVRRAVIPACSELAPDLHTLGVDDFGATRSRRGSCTAFERRNRTWSSASSTLPG